MKRKIFICVYRHIEPSAKQFLKENSFKNFLLKNFYDTYFDDHNYYGWGDDPAFFAAKNYLGDERFATWGVCRTNVRSQLNIGDVVFFICGKQNVRLWNYYYIGFGTVRLNLKNRLEVFFTATFSMI